VLIVYYTSQTIKSDLFLINMLGFIALVLSIHVIIHTTVTVQSLLTIPVVSLVIIITTTATAAVGTS